ncbi:MAG: hypothetical protein JNL96_22565 [Planctomycetaceae bacterium]|nr:hypothetical protein [Planctomycetaceae bacterium]
MQRRWTKWWRALRAQSSLRTSAASLLLALFAQSAQAQQLEPTFEPTPGTAALFEEPTVGVPAQTASYPTSAQPASYQDLEARLRDLESRYEDQQMRFASLAEEKAKAEAPKGTIVGADTKMSGNWKEGAGLETSDKAFKMKWRGRTQFDTVGFTDSSQASFNGLGGNQDDTAVDFRRLRLGTEGTMYEQFDFAVELDFINCFNTNGSTNALAPNNGIKNAFDRQFVGVPAPTDVWVGMHDVPIFGTVRFGNVKPLNALEHTTSSRFLDFMERSLNQDAFVGRFNNGFQPGVVWWNTNEAQTMTWGSWACMNSYNVFAYDAGGLDTGGRVTWTPWYDEESHGRYMLHLGFSATERRCTNGQQRIRARGSVRNGIAQSWSNVADTTTFFSSGETLLVPEIALLLGSFQFQAEYFGQWNRDVAIQTTNVPAQPNPGPNLGTAYFQGYYAQVGYFLTGEHREYERKTGAFGRVVPHENFYFLRNKDKGPIITRGGWQVLYRYTLLDLNDPRLTNVNIANGGNAGVGGGTVYDHTLGLNHFLNPNMKIQYNFVVSDRSISAAQSVIPGQPQVGGTSYGFGWRFALDF